MTYALSKHFSTTGRNLAHSVQERPVWLISPMLDLFFVCGLAPWILGFAIYFVTAGHLDLQNPSQQAVAILFATASLLIGESHQFTSIVRYYGKFRSRTKAYKLDRIPFWIIYAGVALVLYSLTGPTTISWPTWLLTVLGVVAVAVVLPAMSLFPVVLMQHVCAQAQAVGLMYCHLGDYKLSQAERTSITVVSWLLVAAGASTIAKPFGFNGFTSFAFGYAAFVLVTTLALTHGLKPGDRVAAWVLSLLVWGGLAAMVAPDLMAGRPPDAHFEAMVTTILQAIAAALPSLPALAGFATIGFGLQVLRRGFRDNEWLPKGAVVLWANLVLFILVVPLFPTPIMLPIWMLVPVFFHASQHWAVAWYTQAKEIGPGEIDLEKGENSLWKFCNMFLRVQALSLAVLFLPLIAAHISGVQVSFLFGGRGDPSVLSTLPVSWSMVVFYMHYFADRLVWRPLT